MFHVFVYMAGIYADLEGCPFCGHEPEVIECPTGYFVMCTNEDCKCYQKLSKNLDDAVKKWNTRV